MAESLPTSVSTFSRRRARADSTASFSFYQEQDDLEEPVEPLSLADRLPSMGDLDELPFEDEFEEQEDSVDLERDAADTPLSRLSSLLRADTLDCVDVLRWST